MRNHTRTLSLCTAIARCLACAALAATLLFCEMVSAATYTWTGASGPPGPFPFSFQWSNPGNWTGFAPPSSASTTDIFFGATPKLIPIQDMGDPFLLRSITFNSDAGSYSLVGGTLSFQGIATITQNSSAAVTIQNNLAFTSRGTYTGSGPATFSGALSGVGLTSSTFNILTLSGGGTMQSLFVNAGATEVTAGVLNLTQANNTALLVGSATNFTSVTIKGGAVVDAGSTVGGLSIIGGPAVAIAAITGSGSKLSSAVTYVGSFGSSSLGVGEVFVSDGGTLTGTQFSLSGTPDDASSLVLATGGTATHTDASIGWLSGTEGAVIIDGPGSRWTVTNNLVLGVSFTGISNGFVSLSNQGALVARRTVFQSPASAIIVDGGGYATGTLDSEPGSGSISLTDPPSGPAMLINGVSGSGIYLGAISGTGSVRKTGGSTQTLGGANTYRGPTIVDGGTLILASGASPSYTASSGGTLNFTFGSFGFSSLRANSGGAIQYNAPAILGGFLRGVGTHNIDNVTSFSGTTFGADVSLTQDARLTLNNVTNSGSFTNNASLTWDGGSNTSAGSVAVNAALNTMSFENNGAITIARNAVLTNSVTNLVSGGGGRITISSGGQLILSGTSLDLYGSLLVNNGTITGATNVNFGSLAKGAGRYGEVNVTDGGRFSPGNSPGAVTTGSATWSAGGNYLVEMADALANPGEGWDAWLIDGQLNVNGLTSSNGQFTISLSTLDTLATNFDPTRDYAWPILHADGGIVGFDPAELTLDVSAFKNNLGAGRFSLESTATDLVIHFSAIPEPSAMILLASGAFLTPRRRRRSPGSEERRAS